MQRFFRPALAAISVTAIILFSTLIVSSEPANLTVEGTGNYFVTGESYPTSIKFAGYNSRDSKLYLNFDLETTKIVGGTQTATFSYFVDIFSDTNSQLGNLGSYAVPQTLIGAVGSATASTSDKEITLLGPLTAEHKLIVTVKGAAVN